MSALPPKADIAESDWHVRFVLRAGPRHETANLCVAVAVIIGPHNGRAEAVGLGYNGGIRHDEPLSIDAHTIVPILGVPVDVLHAEAVGKRTAQALSAGETVEPWLERRICKSTVVTCVRFGLKRVSSGKAPELRDW